MLIEKKHVKCQNCSYEWDTKSQNLYVSCPKCMYKVNIQKSIIQGGQKLEHFNLDENGVKILDRSIGKDGWIVEVAFKQNRAYCSYHHSSRCNHIEFALSLPEVQEILKAKGWKIA
jgi:DNA-directed RNA polymerase subunit RPC12/RpoP